MLQSASLEGRLGKLEGGQGTHGYLKRVDDLDSAPQGLTVDILSSNTLTICERIMCDRRQSAISQGSGEAGR